MQCERLGDGTWDLGRCGRDVWDYEQWTQERVGGELREEVKGRAVGLGVTCKLDRWVFQRPRAPQA